MAEEFWVITADIVGSRNIKDRDLLQKKLFDLRQKTNRKFKDFIKVKFDITSGDGMQGLLKKKAPLVELMNFWEASLYPSKIRLGIGEGAITTKIYSSSDHMDGPCFVNSKRALDQAKKEKGLVRFGLVDPKFEMALNLIMFFIENIKAKWKEIHFRRYYLYKELGTLEKVAEEDNAAKTKQSIAESLKVAHYNLIVKAENALIFLLSG